MGVGLYGGGVKATVATSLPKGKERFDSPRGYGDVRVRRGRENETP